MKTYGTLLFLLLSSIVFAQQTFLIDEDFENGIPADWSYCSGNWGVDSTFSWKSEDGKLVEGSGPYFGSVLSGILLPEVDLTTISNPILELDLAQGVISADIQFSVWYTDDNSCENIWDTLSAGYIMENWIEIQHFTDSIEIDDQDWIPQDSDYRNLSIDLSEITDSNNIRIVLVAHYMNAWAYGKWYVDDVKVYGDPISSIDENMGQTSLTIYPNPTKDKLYVHREGIQAKAKLKIYNSIGQRVVERPFIKTTEVLDLSLLDAGIYFLEYSTDGSSICKKLIVQ